MENKHLEDLENRISYSFYDKNHLKTALRHSSFVNEQPEAQIEDNERYEFLGDAVLNLIISHILMDRYPALAEGDLSRTRSYLVNENQLAELARNIRLGASIELGKGELQTKGRKKKSILADAFEALTAAVYLDGGFDRTFNMLVHLFAPLLDRVEMPEQYRDYKSQLQEMVQTRFKTTPVYTVVEESGPDHDKTFKVELSVGSTQTRGTGKNKKSAEQAAAKKAMDLLEAE
ncbi:MAG: ribonuclease III [Desulfobacterales bacterium]|nr:ribonuclease III [Desulfobacterales bacterium]